ncbi:Transmembrane protein TauE like protein [Corchorus olitorius]|uniref:Transmembrane protein TauE like protein n=1 Tax=Corchorus olitorius TaxID=93759 RepID=A0A1R3IWZ7_9ROSI|nr:Transmembrane protein TauE like protein [Corchorus olitorius]
MALMAGCLAGVFGIGGGMFISPLLLQVGVTPEVTSATCAFMVFFSSTMSAFQYLLLGMEHIDTALTFSAICFAASVVGLVVVQRFIKELGRASLIVFSLGIVMALSTILMTCFGALNVWEDYSSGKYMGFKLPC